MKIERLISHVCILLVAITLVILCYDAANRFYAEYLFSQAQLQTRFLETEKMMVRALEVLPNSEEYEDKLGMVYFNVLGLSGDIRGLDNASKLFYAAALHNPYNPQQLVHLMQLDIFAIKQGLLKEPSERGLWACDKAIKLDKNNQTIKELCGKLKGAIK